MKKKLCIFSLIFLLGFCSVIVFADYGPTKQEKADINKTLDEYNEDIAEWKTQRGKIIILVIVVGVFGAITGGLQKFHSLKAVIIVTVFLGSAISIVTIVKDVLFDYDHRALSKMIHKGDSVIKDINLEISRGYRLGDKDARDEWYNKIQKYFHEFPLSAHNFNNDNISFNLVPIAYALPQREFQEPSWLSKLPTDKINFFFVGMGDSSSLKKAKEYSFNNAIESGSNYLILQFGTEHDIETLEFDVKSLSEYLTESGEVADTYFKYNPDKNSYRYYTLWKMNRRNAEIDTRLFATKERVHVPKELTQAITNPKESPQDYYLRITAIYNEFFDLARKTLPAEDYEKFNEGRLLKRKGSNEQAIELIEEVLEKHPTFYLGWYNLALSYDSLNDFLNANQAYKKAIELEPEQPKRDASIYNTYGYFLYRHERYEEAIIQLKKALKIDQNHPKAKRTLKAAENAIR